MRSIYTLSAAAALSRRRGRGAPKAPATHRPQQESRHRRPRTVSDFTFPFTPGPAKSARPARTYRAARRNAARTLRRVA